MNGFNFPAVDPLLAFNTTISFITNTELASLWRRVDAVEFQPDGRPSLFRCSPRRRPALSWQWPGSVHSRSRNGGSDLGNFYRDFIRFITRVLLPICFVVAFFMIAQGAVQTLDASMTAHTLQGGDQTMVVGPVASQGTIELIGTNGGGFYNANAAHPFQNPTPLTNIVLIILMASLPASIIVTFGEMIGNRRQAWVLYAVLGTLMVLFLLLCVVPEQHGTPMLANAGVDMHATTDQPGGNMEGKEARFGISASGLFAAITTAFTTGAVTRHMTAIRRSPPSPCSGK